MSDTASPQPTSTSPHGSTGSPQYTRHSPTTPDWLTQTRSRRAASGQPALPTEMLDGRELSARSRRELEGIRYAMRLVEA
ncbi:hypothetical protein DDV98_04580 [Streptomyces sp. IB2014 011-12]|nr:hypothetical protein DDV98_04580 [Streptomyces sp. IB2014 011-12]